MNAFQFIFQYIKRHKVQYTLGIITLFVVDFANIFIPKLTGVITDGLTAHSLDWSGVRLNLLYLFLLGLLLAVGRFFWRYFLFGASRSIEKELRNDMFAHLEKMDVEYYNEHKTGDLMTRFTSDLNAIRMAIGPAVICVFDASVMTIMVIFQMMYYVSVKLTLIAVIPMLFILFGEIYYGKIIRPRFTARQEAVSDLTDYVQESFSGIRVIKAFVREKAQRYHFLKENENTMEKNLSIAKIQSIVIPLLDVIIGLSSLLTLIYGGYLALIGDITLGRFVAFNQYINMLVWPMLACGDSVNMFSQGAASIRRIQEIFKEQPLVDYILVPIGGGGLISGIALAMYKRVDPDKRDKYRSMFLSTVLAVFLTGVTEPLEFMFMFCALPLYLVYAVLQGCAFAMAGIIHLRLHSFGNLEFITRIPMSVKAGLTGDLINFVICVVAFFVIGYVVAYFMIGKFHFATPGRLGNYTDDGAEEEDQGSTQTGSKEKKDSQAERIIALLGGRENIVLVDACMTRLRVTVKDVDKVAELPAWKAEGALGLLKKDGGIQAVYGPKADVLKSDINDIL